MFAKKSLNLEIRSGYKKPPTFDHLFEALNESHSDQNSLNGKVSPSVQNEMLLKV